MMNILESAKTYSNTPWDLTFYFVIALAFLIGLFITYKKSIKGIKIENRKNKRVKK